MFSIIALKLLQCIIYYQDSLKLDAKWGQLWIKPGWCCVQHTDIHTPRVLHWQDLVWTKRRGMSYSANIDSHIVLFAFIHWRWCLLIEQLDSMYQWVQWCWSEVMDASCVLFLLYKALSSPHVSEWFPTTRLPAVSLSAPSPSPFSAPAPDTASVLSPTSPSSPRRKCSAPPS